MKMEMQRHKQSLAKALFAPVLQPGNQYGATTKFAQFTSRKGQISENIR